MLPRWLLLGWLALAPALRAQNVFVTVEDGKPQVVKQIRRQTPMIESGGKLVPGGGSQYGFARAIVYRTGLVTFDKNFSVRASHLEVMNQGSLNYELHIDGRVKSDTTFRHCFMVLDIAAWKDKGIAFAELPDLVAGEEVQLNLAFPLLEHIEEGTYRLHLFSDGIELLHSKMSSSYLATQKKKTADLLSGAVKDFPPVLAHRVAPVYPEALKKSGVTGSARVRCHLGKNGDVTSVELVSATAPAFGEAALAAAPRWKFDPAIQGLQFAEANVEVPVEFRPPKKS